MNQWKKKDHPRKNLCSLLPSCTLDSFMATFFLFIFLLIILIATNLLLTLIALNLDYCGHIIILTWFLASSHPHPCSLLLQWESSSMNHFIDQVRPASSVQNQTFHNWSQLALTHLTFLHLLMWSSIPGRLYELEHFSMWIWRSAHHLFHVYFIECRLCTWYYVLRVLQHKTWFLSFQT